VHARRACCCQLADTEVIGLRQIARSVRHTYISLGVSPTQLVGQLRNLSTIYNISALEASFTSIPDQSLLDNVMETKAGTNNYKYPETRLI
jgi:hypothetical protein